MKIVSHGNSTYFTYRKKSQNRSAYFSRARKFLDKKNLTQLYYSFIYPYLTYCNIIWGNAPDYILWPIFRAQKRAIRIISNIRRRESTKLAFQSLQILRLPDIYTFSALIYVYKYKNGLLPSPFDSFYITNSQIHGYPTRKAAQLRAPATKTKIATSFIKRTGVNIWNNFSTIITQHMKIGAFKKAIIANLITKYDPPNNI